MKTTTIPEIECKCGYTMNRTSSVQGDFKPKKGDYSLCINCGELYVFKTDLSQRPANVKENKAFSKDPDAVTFIKMRQLRKASLSPYQHSELIWRKTKSI